MPAVVKRLRAQWPAAKTFSAAVKYLPEVVAEVEQSERRTMQARQESIRQQGIDQQAARQANERQDFLALWRPRFDSLPIDEQHKLRETALAQNPILAKMPSVLEDHCLRRTRQTIRRCRTVCKLTRKQLCERRATVRSLPREWNGQKTAR